MQHKLDFVCKAQNEPTPTNTMVTRLTPSAALGHTGNLQGTYKFFSPATGQKIKRREYTPYPMPDLVIKKVDAFGKSNALLGSFDFADRNSILFEWNKEVDNYPEGILELDNVILYPSLAAKHPGVVLGQDQPLPLIKEELIPQGHAKDATALNANLVPFNVAGVVASLIVHANANKINDNKNNDNSNSSMAVDNIPQQPHHAPIVINGTNDDDKGSDGKPADAPNGNNNHYNDDDKESIVNSLEEGDEDVPAKEHEPDKDGNQGVRRLRCKGRGVMKKNVNYSLLMAARQNTRGEPRWALICDGCVFFLMDKLSNAKPIPEEDREEYTFGVVLVHYSMNAGIKKVQRQGQSRSDQGAHSDA
jgi:hypothetical protein